MAVAALHPLAEADRLNLLSLCERRWLEAHRGRSLLRQVLGDRPALRATLQAEGRALPF